MLKFFTTKFDETNDSIPFGKDDGSSLMNTTNNNSIYNNAADAYTNPHVF